MNATSHLFSFNQNTHNEHKINSILSINPTKTISPDIDEENVTNFNQSTMVTAITTAVSTVFNDSNNNQSTDWIGPKSERHLGWTNLILALGLCVLIVITVIGNTLVIISVLTTRRLRTVTNCFVMSLAVADWLVGIFVMPPAVALYLIGKFISYFILYNFLCFFQLL